MEQGNKTADIQRQVDVYLRGYFRSGSASTQDIAAALVNFALDQEENPVKDLFRHTLAPLPSYTPAVVQPPPTEAVQAVRPRSSRLNLFSRNRDRQPKAKSSVSEVEKCRQEFQTFFAVDVAFANEQPNKAVQPSGSASVDPSGEISSHARSPIAGQPKPKAKAGSSAAATYNCIFCESDYSAKGTCKRHLEEIHVAKRYFECVKCKYTSFTVPEARKHSGHCSAGIIGYTTLKPPHQNFYSSEFIVAQPFSTQQQYIDHLLDLCTLPKNERPRRSLHLKLRNLLSQPAYADAVREVSLRLYGNPDRWREKRWPQEPLRRAVKELEYGTLNLDAGTKDPAQLLKVRSFVEDLFEDRTPQTTPGDTLHASPSVTNMGKLQSVEVEEGMGPPAMPAHAYRNQQASGGQQMTAIANGDNFVASNYFPIYDDQNTPTTSEPNSKRPLSHETAANIPLRHPPGPPTPSLRTMQHETMNMAQEPGFTTRPPGQVHTYPFRQAGAGQPVIEQPPPYDLAYTPMSATCYPTDGGPGEQPFNDTLFSHVPYDPQLERYMPQQDDVLNFHAQTTHLNNHHPVSNNHAPIPEDVALDFSSAPFSAHDDQAMYHSWFPASGTGGTGQGFDGSYLGSFR